VTSDSPSRSRGLAIAVGLAACLVLSCAGAVSAQVRGTYLYTLSNFAGSLRYDWVRVHVDPGKDEIYVLYQNMVRIFSPTGMEVFSFGEDLDLGQILDAAVDDKGDVYLLSFKEHVSVTRCSFRGVPIGPFEIKNLPPGVGLGANRMLLRNGLFYFVSTNSSNVIVADANGEFREQIDLLSFVDAEATKKDGAEVVGFTVDGEGNIFFTVPVLFQVYKLSSDRKVTSFGRPGSSAGKFGIIAGVVSDSRGNVLVADKLRCVVMAFDKGFNFLGEFGYRGDKAANLVVPDDLAIDEKDRLYVSQGRKRGVSVFALAHD